MAPVPSPSSPRALRDGGKSDHLVRDLVAHRGSARGSRRAGHCREAARAGADGHYGALFIAVVGWAVLRGKLGGPLQVARNVLLPAAVATACSWPWALLVRAQLHPWRVPCLSVGRLYRGHQLFPGPDPLSGSSPLFPRLSRDAGVSSGPHSWSQHWAGCPTSFFYGTTRGGLGYLWPMACLPAILACWAGRSACAAGEP